MLGSDRVRNQVSSLRSRVGVGSQFGNRVLGRFSSQVLGSSPNSNVVSRVESRGQLLDIGSRGRIVNRLSGVYNAF